MAKRAALRKEEITEPSLPGVIIPPSEAPDNQKSAYWLELVDNPAEFRKAIATEDFFPLLRKFPDALWTDNRLTLYLYRRPDDEGLMVKNPDGAKRKYAKVYHQPVDEEFISAKWGGGKYTLYLKLDNDSTLKECTFMIDGPPKVQPGQTIEVEGKSVPIGTHQPAPAVNQERSDVAAVIEASANANDKSMEILAKASSTAIEMVREQASNAAKPDSSSGMIEKLVELLMARVLTPPPAAADPIDSFIKLQTLINKNTPEREEKENSLDQSLGILEKLTGTDSIADLIVKRAKNVDADPTPSWLPLALGVAEKFFSVVPTLFQQSLQARELAFRREAFLRTAQPGAAVPKELLAAPAPPPQQPTQTAAQPPQPTPPALPAQPDATQIVPMIVQMIVHGFNQNPHAGMTTAAAIDFNFGQQIEALGLGAFLSDDAQVKEFVTGQPLLAQCSKDARWANFQEDFLQYMEERFGAAEPDDEGDEEKSTKGPQPVGA